MVRITSSPTHPSVVTSMYSGLNFLWEAWLRVFTNNKPEAVENKAQGKGPREYQELMEKCFAGYYRVLKPGRWITVVFHNSQNRIWNAIQEAILRAGFVIADVRTLDKKQGTFKQVTSTTAVEAGPSHLRLQAQRRPGKAISP